MAGTPKSWFGTSVRKARGLHIGALAGVFEADSPGVGRSRVPQTLELTIVAATLYHGIPPASGRLWGLQWAAVFDLASWTRSQVMLLGRTPAAFLRPADNALKIEVGGVATGCSVRAQSAERLGLPTRPSSVRPGCLLGAPT